MKSVQLPPVVFLGPTAPAAEIMSILPGALIQPPVRRGDLYKYRILKHQMFLILDGLFASTLAISPREVVDVVKDGATVVGASSMGALRAADCFPAGALGIGAIFRLFRRRAISSEDEVAISYREDKPFPPLTEPLINIRIALRHAIKRGLIEVKVGDRILSAAESARFSNRTWRKAFLSAGHTPPTEVQEYLATVDAKRADGVLAARRVSAWLEGDESLLNVSNHGPQLFGLLDEGRERSPDPLDGAERHEIATEFLSWLCASGRIQRMAAGNRAFQTNWLDDQAQVPIKDIWDIFGNSTEVEVELVRFNIFRRAVWEAHRFDLRPETRDTNLAELEISAAHFVPSWHDLLNSFGRGSPFSVLLTQHRDKLALTKCLRRKLFSSSSQEEVNEAFLWQR
jgi:hypothetical protein